MTAPIIAFSTEVLGFTPSPGQATILDEIYADDIRTAVLRLGRRAGKGRLAAIVATYEATSNAAAHLVAVPPGEQVAIVIVATNQRQARIVHRYIRGFLGQPAFADLIARDTTDEIELTNGIVILTMPCHAASARGLAIAVLVLDEAAWYTGRDGSPLDPKEIWDALAPSTAQFPEGRILVLSTPRWSVGWFAEQVELAKSGAFPAVRTWHATTAEMNPRIATSFLATERAKDPASFRREYEAEFESGVGAVFDAELVRSAVQERGSLPATATHRYVIALDAAFTGDAFAAIVGHVDPSARVIVDHVTGWQGSRTGPVQIDATLDEVAALARSYNGARCLIDQYAAEPIRQGLRKRSIEVLERPWTNERKVDAVAAVRQALYGDRLDLPAHARLVSELITLEQRPTPSGRPRIAAPGGAHDDYATCLMALVLDLAGPQVPVILAFYRDELARQRQRQEAPAS